MKSLFRWSLVLALLLTLGLVGGCSDDDEPTGPAEKAVGNVDDPEFMWTVGAMDEMEEFGDEMMAFLLLGIDTVLQTQGAGSPFHGGRQFQAAGIEADSVYLTYHETSQYWYLFFQGVETIGPEETTVTVIDSIQFLHATGPVQWPDSVLLTGVNNGVLLNLESNLGSVIAAHQQITLTGELLTDGDVVLSGTQGFDVFLVGPPGSCTLDLNMSTTATSVGLNIEHTDAGGCPESGVLRYTGTIGVTCPVSPPVVYNDSWTIVMTFTGNDEFRIVAENATTRWTYNGSCIED